MSKSNAFETAFLNLVFGNQALQTIGDAAGLLPSAADGNLYMSLHTSSPGEAGTQATNEIAYTSYARQAVSRATGFTVTANAVALDEDVDFPAGSGGTGTATHWGLGAEVSGATLLLYYGEIDIAIVCGTGVTPRLEAGTVVTES